MSMYNGQTDPARAVDSLPLELPPPAHGSGKGDLVMSPQADAAPKSPRSDLDRVVPGVPYVPASGSGPQPAGQGKRMGTQGKHGGTSANGGPPGSKAESLPWSPYMANLSVSEGASTHRGGVDTPVPVAPPLPTEREKSVKEVLQSTLEAAQQEFVMARRTGRMCMWAFWVLVVLCGFTFTFGLTTAMWMKQSFAIVTWVLSLLSYATALCLGSEVSRYGNPEEPSWHPREVKRFIDDLQRFMAEHGHLARSAKLPETEAMLARFKTLKLSTHASA